MAGSTLLETMRAIVAGDRATLARMLADPELAVAVLERGASRTDPAPYFFEAIRHHVYAGDTALHVAAAAHRAAIVRTLLTKGASVRARNRLGAEPLHYAVDGGPGNPAWDRSRPNGRGSKPLQLAKLTTGRSGSGSPAAKAQQAELLRLLS